MDIGEMVDKLVEQRIREHVEKQTGEWCHKQIEDALAAEVSARVDAIIRDRRAEIVKMAEQYLDASTVEIEWKWGGPEIRLVKKEIANEGL